VSHVDVTLTIYLYLLYGTVVETVVDLMVHKTTVVSVRLKALCLTKLVQVVQIHQLVTMLVLLLKMVAVSTTMNVEFVMEMILLVLDVQIQQHVTMKVLQSKMVLVNILTSAVTVVAQVSQTEIVIVTETYLVLAESVVMLLYVDVWMRQLVTLMIPLQRMMALVLWTMSVVFVVDLDLLTERVTAMETS
jgi:hypothetical protein